jgi:hypothetical protein
MRGADHPARENKLLHGSPCSSYPRPLAVFQPETVKNPNANRSLLSANTGKEGPIFQKSFIGVFFHEGEMLFSQLS